MLLPGGALNSRIVNNYICEEYQILLTTGQRGGNRLGDGYWTKPTETNSERKLPATSQQLELKSLFEGINTLFTENPEREAYVSIRPLHTLKQGEQALLNPTPKTWTEKESHIHVVPDPDNGRLSVIDTLTQTRQSIAYADLAQNVRLKLQARAANPSLVQEDKAQMDQVGQVIEKFASPFPF